MRERRSTAVALLVVLLTTIVACSETEMPVSPTLTAFTGETPSTSVSDFSGFTTGVSVNGQPVATYAEGWTVEDWFGRTPSDLGKDPFDEEVTDLGGNVVWRLSAFVTHPELGLQPNTPTAPAVAGETGAGLWNDLGTDPTSPLDPPDINAKATSDRFHARLRFKSVTGASQCCITYELAPVAKQSPWLMSSLLIADNSQGLILTFKEVGAGGFTLFTTLDKVSYTKWHTVDIYVDFEDGLQPDGSANDIVYVILNGTLIHTGTTFEAYYRDSRTDFDPRQAVDALMIRPTGKFAVEDGGLYFDDVVVDNASFAVDDEPPAVTDVLATLNPVEVGGYYDLTANVDDTDLGDSHIASAEYSTDGGTSWISMAASDGAFDEVFENVQVLDVTAPAEAGLHELCARGTDAEGNTSAPECLTLVVYDPDAGFVTGGGWISSPAGAYVPDPSLTGKASFGFVSKYQKGADTPSGNTEFQFKAGELNFHSSSYDWLVVTGSDYARFKGEGTINGMGNYTFMLWAGDGTGTDGGDTFRIKIWEEVGGVEDVIYDNGMDQDIGGGNIIVHKGTK